MATGSSTCTPCIQELFGGRLPQLHRPVQAALVISRALPLSATDVAAAPYGHDPVPATRQAPPVLRATAMG
jgi:hypothetical protein